MATAARSREHGSLTPGSPAPSRRFLRGDGDERLVARVRAGDEQAFAAIYERYAGPLVSFCRHMLGSREEAEDAVQHTLLSAHRALLADDRPIVLKAWLYAIARNRSLSVLRARRDELALDDVSAAVPSTAGLSAEVERRAELRDLVADVGCLPDDQRAALVLAELGAHSHDEIGDLLGVKRDKVKALIFQARESLAATRTARDTPCADIRRELATATGAALRRSRLRRHLDVCPGCRDFRDEVRRQRTALAIALPVVPTLALRHAVLGATTSGGAALGAGAGAGAGAGGAAASAGVKATLVKVLAAAAIAGGAGGGGYAVVHAVRHHHGGAGVAAPAEAAEPPAVRSSPTAARTPLPPAVRHPRRRLLTVVARPHRAAAAPAHPLRPAVARSHPHAAAAPRDRARTRTRSRHHPARRAHRAPAHVHPATPPAAPIAPPPAPATAAPPPDPAESQPPGRRSHGNDHPAEGRADPPGLVKPFPGLGHHYGRGQNLDGRARSSPEPGQGPGAPGEGVVPPGQSLGPHGRDSGAGGD